MPFTKMQFTAMSTLPPILGASVGQQQKNQSQYNFSSTLIEDTKRFQDMKRMVGNLNEESQFNESEESKDFVPSVSL